jgi:DNA-binding NarL/FixJ family response regulator
MLEPESQPLALDAFLQGRLRLLGVARSGGGLSLLVRCQNPTERAATLPKERLVLALLGEGASQKQIAYEMGVSAPAVSHCVRGLLARLKLEQTMHLIVLLRAIEGIAEGELVATGRPTEPAVFPLHVTPDPDLVAKLTLSELDVTLSALEGRGNSTIADRRQRSLRTVVNQLAAVFKKLGISGRLELASRLTLRGSCRRVSGKVTAFSGAARREPDPAATGYDGAPRWMKSPPAAPLANATSIVGC